MKTALYAILFLAILTSKSLGQNPAEDFTCSYSGSQKNPSLICENLYNFTSNHHAEEVIDRILKPIGLTRNFIVQECPKTENCFATVRKGIRYIIYDNEFMKEIENNTQTNWSAVSIMAHEIGHHLQGHTIEGTGSRPQKELEADKFSGFVMHQLGASLDESQITLKMYQDEEGNGTHPSRAARMAAVEKGWSEAESIYPKIKENNRINVQSLPKKEVEIVISKKETGCISGNCVNGYGTFVHISDGYYTGKWQESRRDGLGIHYNPDGSKRYEGEYENGKRQGIGKYYFKNGDWYEGEFYQNKMKGRGKYHYANGDIYAGEFDEDKVVIRSNYMASTR